MTTDMNDLFEVICSSEDREEWLAFRMQGLGASDTPALFGAVAWASPISIAAQKAGLVEGPNDNEFMAAGRRLEPFIAEWTLEEMGKKGRPFGMLLRSVPYSWLLCTPDWMVEEPTLGGNMVPLQIKNTMKSSEWEDGVPEAVMIQCQQELIVTGAAWGYAAALLTGNRLRWIRVDPDLDMQTRILEVTADFWKRFKNGDPIDVDGSEATKNALAAMHPDDNGETVALSAELMEECRDRDEHKLILKGLQAKIREAENRLKAAIGDATYGTFPDGSGLSLKTQGKEGERVQKTSKFRVLRRQGAK